MNKPDFSIETSFLAKGYKLIAGVDEVGRGALAGPLCVGLVIYDLENTDLFHDDLQYINDSKKISHAKRIVAEEIIYSNAVTAATRFISHRSIDATNINIATETAIKRLLGKLHIRPDLILMDGSFKFDFGIPSVSIIKGDQKSLSIASASIVAKVRRDRVMVDFDSKFNVYGFKTNMGYGTKLHRHSIQKHGPSPIHRLSYEPLKSMGH